MKTFFLYIIIALSTIAGCATIIDGTKEQMTFVSDPKGAIVSINGKKVGVTPITLLLPKETETKVTFEKEGYATQTITLGTNVNGWGIWGNLLLGGVGGIFSTTTDATSGALHEYELNSYYINLTKESDALSSNINTSKNDNNKSEIKKFIIISYRNLIADISNGHGEYLDSLLSLLEVKDKEAAIQKIKALSSLYTVIPEFATKVSEYNFD